MLLSILDKMKDFKSWPIDLLKVVNEYHPKFMFPIHSNYYVWPEKEVWIDGEIHSFPNLPFPEDSPVVCSSGNTVYMIVEEEPQSCVKVNVDTAEIVTIKALPSPWVVMQGWAIETDILLFVLKEEYDATQYVAVYNTLTNEYGPLIQLPHDHIIQVGTTTLVEHRGSLSRFDRTSGKTQHLTSHPSCERGMFPVAIDDDHLITLSTHSYDIFEYCLSSNKWRQRKEVLPMQHEDHVHFDTNTQSLYFMSCGRMYTKKLSDDSSAWNVVNIKDVPRRVRT